MIPFWKISDWVKGATDEEVLRAAKLANCNEFAEKLPNGYQTMIGENGSALSGGERQRISIARAFLKDAPIILLMKQRLRWTLKMKRSFKRHFLA